MIRGGDTPEKTLWQYHTENRLAFFAGEMLIKGNTSEISVFGVNRTTYYVLNEQGKVMGTGSNNVEMLLNEIKSAAELSTNKKVVSIGIIQSEYNVGDILSDFNSYLDIS